MRVFKRGKVYWMDLMHDGVRVRESTKMGNRRAAEEIAALKHAELVKHGLGVVKRKQAPIFQDAMATFLAWSETEHRAKPATYRRDCISSVALLRHFDGQRIDSIDVTAVERYRGVRLQECKTVRSKDGRRVTDAPVRPATVNRELACLRHLFNHAIRNDVLVQNPVSKVRLLAENNQQERVVSFEEQARYLRCASPMLQDIAGLILETGMRPDEVYRLQPGQVNLEQSFLKITEGKTPAAKRRVELTVEACRILRERMAACEGAYLFAHDADASRPVPKVNNAHDRALVACKVKPFRLYDLRHTWATRAVEAGVDLVTLAAMMGHARVQMVMRYAHPTQGHQLTAMQKMEQFAAARKIVP